MLITVHQKKVLKSFKIYSNHQIIGVVIAITENRIPKNVSVTQNIELSNYSCEHTPKECSTGKILLDVVKALFISLDGCCTRFDIYFFMLYLF